MKFQSGFFKNLLKVTPVFPLNLEIIPYSDTERIVEEQMLLHTPQSLSFFLDPITVKTKPCDFLKFSQLCDF